MSPLTSSGVAARPAATDLMKYGFWGIRVVASIESLAKTTSAFDTRCGSMQVSSITG